MSSMRLDTLTVGALQAKCYILSVKDTREAVIIDPGDDAEYISQHLLKEGLVPRVIIATHGHFDHIMGVFSLQSIYNIPFLLHRDDEFLVKRMEETAKYFLGVNIQAPKPHVNGYLDDTYTFALGKNRLQILHTPGHTPGSVCIVDSKDKAVFVGDVIFANGGVGRTDFSYSSTDMLHDSIRTVLNLDPSNKLYPGHGEATTVRNEKRFFQGT